MNTTKGGGPNVGLKNPTNSMQPNPLVNKSYDVRYAELVPSTGNSPTQTLQNKVQMQKTQNKAEMENHIKSIRTFVSKLELKTAEQSPKQEQEQEQEQVQNTRTWGDILKKIKDRSSTPC